MPWSGRLTISRGYSNIPIMRNLYWRWHDHTPYTMRLSMAHRRTWESFDLVSLGLPSDVRVAQWTMRVFWWGPQWCSIEDNFWTKQIETETCTKTWNKNKQGMELCETSIASRNTKWSKCKVCTFLVENKGLSAPCFRHADLQETLQDRQALVISQAIVKWHVLWPSWPTNLGCFNSFTCAPHPLPFGALWCWLCWVLLRLSALAAWLTLLQTGDWKHQDGAGGL